MKFNLSEVSHTRYNPLTGEWILVSPHRSKRPWQGKVEAVPEVNRPAYDRQCYLCPGNERAGGIRNPDYKDTFVFTNDFSALQQSAAGEGFNENDLLIANAEPGICKVICFSPRHDLTLSQMNRSDIVKVITVWITEFVQTSLQPEINYVQIFENKGEMMGCSNPHPHGQIWAQKSIPVEVLKEGKHLKEYYEKNSRSLLSDYLEAEIKKNERVVFQNNSFVIVIPFWATWPFETLIIPRTHAKDISNLSEAEKEDFAEAVKKLTMGYDRLFHVSFPYSAGIHQAPADNNDNVHWHWHMHFYPPLLRSATIKKFMVGYEMLANPQRDTTPEYSAQLLKELI